jgi:pyridoxal biosynthesis lyase PdxS
LFVVGGIATQADAATRVQLGADRHVLRFGHLQVRQPRPRAQVRS